MRQIKKIGLSLAVISALSLGFSGCGSSSSNPPPGGDESAKKLTVKSVELK